MTCLTHSLNSVCSKSRSNRSYAGGVSKYLLLGIIFLFNQLSPPTWKNFTYFVFVTPRSRLNFVHTSRLRHLNPSASLPYMLILGSRAENSGSNMFFHLQKLHQDFNIMTLGFLQLLIVILGTPSLSLKSKRRLAARWKSARMSLAKLLKVSLVRCLHT